MCALPDTRSPEGPDGLTDADRFAGQFLVRRYRILGTQTVVYDAWEPDVRTARTGDGFFGHAMLTHHAGRWWGQIGTGPLPASVDALPARSEARGLAYRAWEAAEHERAYVLIVQAFREAASGRRHDGEITRRVALPPSPDDRREERS